MPLKEGHVLLRRGVTAGTVWKGRGGAERSGEGRGEKILGEEGSRRTTERVFGKRVRTGA